MTVSMTLDPGVVRELDRRGGDRARSGLVETAIVRFLNGSVSAQDKLVKLAGAVLEADVVTVDWLGLHLLAREALEQHSKQAIWR